MIYVNNKIIELYKNYIKLNYNIYISLLDSAKILNISKLNILYDLKTEITTYYINSLIYKLNSVKINNSAYISLGDLIKLVNGEINEFDNDIYINY